VIVDPRARHDGSSSSDAFVKFRSARTVRPYIRTADVEMRAPDGSSMNGTNLSRPEAVHARARRLPPLGLVPDGRVRLAHQLLALRMDAEASDDPRDRIPCHLNKPTSRAIRHALKLWHGEERRIRNIRRANEASSYNRDGSRVNGRGGDDTVELACDEISRTLMPTRIVDVRKNAPRRNTGHDKRGVRLADREPCRTR
jgi:hypothetical protein